METVLIILFFCFEYYLALLLFFTVFILISLTHEHWTVLKIISKVKSKNAKQNSAFFHIIPATKEARVGDLFLSTAEMAEITDGYRWY